MIKSELIAKLASENPHLTQRDVERVVGVVLDRMASERAELESELAEVRVMREGAYR